MDSNDKEVSVHSEKVSDNRQSSVETQRWKPSHEKSPIEVHTDYIMRCRMNNSETKCTLSILFLQPTHNHLLLYSSYRVLRLLPWLSASLSRTFIISTASPLTRAQKSCV